MDKWVYRALRVVAVLFVIGGLALTSLGVAEAWTLFTTGSQWYTRHEEIVYGMMDVVGVVVCLTIMGGLAYAMWNIEKILARF